MSSISQEGGRGLIVFSDALKQEEIVQYKEYGEKNENKQHTQYSCFDILF